MTPDATDTTDTPADRRFVAAPQAAVAHPEFRLAWPKGGLPVALDPAAATILDLFDQPLSAQELAADLVAALDLEPTVAARSASSVTATLLRTGHLIPEGMDPMPEQYLSYPPSASP